ncbi:helix-turn-helix domain-containing protein [Virgibacillus sp. AGTR]|uniref:helix-turn-helix domain-containing protein n=1 Tax=Virgibacillus sp. AGTR TaxID=2812055 RepID=UPI001D16EDE6|nr:helix-turn-helix domain-containing protein [Virgibacillus sp. AGTR]MCC2248912.1 helix-turn-helix domain-containing protein [Virgibacillus sp. AGTR]
MSVIDSVKAKQISLYDMRLSSRITGSVVAQFCRTTYRSLRNWEKGTTIPNIVNVHDLLQIYDHSFYDLDLTLYTARKDRTSIQQRIDNALQNKMQVGKPITNLSLQDMRQHCGYSGAAVAEICEVSYRSIRNWETGAFIPNVIHANDLLTLYGYAFYDLDLTPFYTMLETRLKRKGERTVQMIDNLFTDKTILK